MSSKVALRAGAPFNATRACIRLEDVEDLGHVVVSTEGQAVGLLLTGGDCLVTRSTVTGLLYWWKPRADGWFEQC